MVKVDLVYIIKDLTRRGCVIMKSKEEILKRAIILLAFSDRCALEKNLIDGVITI